MKRVHRAVVALALGTSLVAGQGVWAHEVKDNQRVQGMIEMAAAIAQVQASFSGARQSKALALPVVTPAGVVVVGAGQGEADMKTASGIEGWAWITIAGAIAALPGAGAAFAGAALANFHVHQDLGLPASSGEATALFDGIYGPASLRAGVVWTRGSKSVKNRQTGKTDTLTYWAFAKRLSDNVLKEIAAQYGIPAGNGAGIAGLIFEAKSKPGVCQVHYFYVTGAYVNGLSATVLATMVP